MTVTVRDTAVHVESLGEGMPLVALHGFATDHRAMKGMLEPILSGRSGYQRIYLDLPGMGRSEGAEWITGSDRLLDAVVGAIDAIVPEQRFLLAGQSYGAYLARGVLRRRRSLVAGMLLVAPMFEEAGKRVLPTTSHALIDETALDDCPAEQRELLAHTMVVQNEQTLARVRDEIFPGLALADGKACERIRQNYAFSFDPDDLAEPFDRPVLIVAGRHDRVTGYEGGKRLVDRYARASFAVLDDAGHGVHIERPNLFGALVAEWLGRVERDRATERGAETAAV